MSEVRQSSARRPKAPANATVAVLVQPYLDERTRRRELCEASVRQHRSVLHRFADVVDVEARRLTLDDVERWLESRDRLKAATRRSEVAKVRSYCGWLARRGYVRFDPSVELPRVRVPRYVPRAQNRTKVGQLIAAAPDVRGRLICLLMVQEGLRCCEVAGLQLGDIDFDTRWMRVVGKGDHERMLPLSVETWSALETYLAEHPATSGPLLRSYKREWRGLSADHISGLVSGWMSAAGIKRWARDGVSAHALRHTCATDMVHRGTHVLDIRQAMGHAHLATTEIYLPSTVKDLREAMGGRSYVGDTPDAPVDGGDGPGDEA